MHVGECYKHVTSIIAILYSGSTIKTKAFCSPKCYRGSTLSTAKIVP